jgi:hypothetical protein
MGLFLMESLRFTHLFPLSNIDEKMRRRMVIISFSILFILAGVEVALAVMRDMIISADIALKQTLGNAIAPAAAVDDWVMKIPAAGQMILGFILPFALAFVAIPLEYFIYSARTVSGALLVMAIRGLGFLARTAASAIRQAGTTLIMLYDVIIFLPLLIERLVQSMRAAPAASPPAGKSAGVAAFPKRNLDSAERTATGDHIL